MTFTQQCIDVFHRFARKKLSGIESAMTLEDCIRLWRAEREEAETIAAISRGEEDIEAGRYSTLEEVDAEIRRRLSRMRERDL